MKGNLVVTALLTAALSLGLTATSSFARGEGKSAAGLSRSGQGTSMGAKVQQQTRTQIREQAGMQSQSQYRYGQSADRPEAGTPRGTGDGTADQLKTGDRLQERIHQIPDETAAGN